jgi:hypothetical protein
MFGAACVEAAASSTLAGCGRRRGSSSLIGGPSRLLSVIHVSSRAASSSSSAPSSSSSPHQRRYGSGEDSAATSDWWQNSHHQLPSERQMSHVCRAELREEELRDAVQGVQAIAPMVPPGWSMEPRGTSTNYFILTRNTLGSSSTGRHSKGDDDEGGTVMLSHRRFRSRQQEAIEEMERDLAARRQLSNRSPMRKPPSLASNRRSAARESLLPVRPSVQIFCPMRTIDPSLHDSSVDLCEWTAFDVLVRKQGESPSSSDSKNNNNVGTCVRTADALMLSMASVNSELRIRSAQVLSPKQAQTAMSPKRLEDSLGVEGVSHMSVLSPAVALDAVTAFDLSGEYYRDTQLYKGPLLSELSKPMQDELYAYVHNVLGVTAELREFIAQMLFVLEQEAYTAWLAQVDHFCLRK